MKNLIMKYKIPAQDSVYGWENESLPIGNGYIGANIFGIVERERVQITHNALVNPHYDEEGRMFGGLGNFAEMYFEFSHHNVCQYERGLCLDDAIAYCNYVCDGVKYEREYFASYPDKALVIQFRASQIGELSFDIKPIIPFVKEYAVAEGDGGGKSGVIEILDNTIVLKGKLEYYNLNFEAQIKVISDGQVNKISNGLNIKNATTATVIFVADTNYVLCEHTFCEDNPKKKLPDINVHDVVLKTLNSALNFNYEELKQKHISDYQSLFKRVNLRLCDGDADYISEMMDKYRKGENVPALEELYFQYGRYLLISSSRKGGLPANLQGIWNCHEFSPWGSGYWHNINVQMNYWPAFNTNLLETFEPYIDFFNAYCKKAEEYASEYIKEHNPENYKEGQGECGWTIGTAAYPYFITAPSGHSGPGTGALTSKLFWEAYEFSGDKELLKNVTYPALLGMSKFLTKTVKNYDGEYLVSFSASPEQMNNGVYIDNGTYYQTVGCAFDQQMIYENGKDFIKASEILNINDEAVRIQKKQIDKYHPIRIGWSGQIKEFLEEKFYGEIGEYNHRHISQLMALYPGTLINSDIDAWLDAAIYTLTQRGDDSTGWALAHRLNAWARTGDGNHAYKLITELISNKTNPNLWDEHPPFQIDGNFGATSGIAEMLLQSHEGYIHILPALPDCWDKGKISGLTARGAFEVDIEWENNSPEKVTVKSLKGNTICVKANFSKNVTVNGEKHIPKDGIVEFESKAGESHVIECFLPKSNEKPITDINVSDSLEITWQGGRGDILRAVDGAPVYECIAKDALPPFKDNFDFSKAEIITYKVKNSAGGVFKAINHATKLDVEIYKNIINSKKV